MGQLDENLRMVSELCEFIQSKSSSGDPLTLTDLSEHVGLSPFHLQRTFKAAVGITPKQYVEACRMNRLKTALRRKDKSVTESIYDAGFGSSSRVYERLDTSLGMTPSQYRGGGKDLAISYASAETSLGLLMVAATDRGLCSVQFGETHNELLSRLRLEFPAALLGPMPASHAYQLELWIEALSKHLGGQPIDSEIPLDIRASAFRIKVWRYLQSIPYGETRSYSEVARGIGKPKAARAVASACATNPLAIVIPCHRVIRGTGDLAGYRWGSERKRALLEQEKSQRQAVRGL